MGTMGIGFRPGWVWESFFPVSHGTKFEWGSLSPALYLLNNRSVMDKDFGSVYTQDRSLIFFFYGST